MKTIAIFILLLTSSAFGATYYVDYASGADTNNGTAKGTPWKHAPGMPGCANTCNSTVLAAGDQVIFKGGIVWSGTDSFTWTQTANGTNGNPIYFGVDQTWFDTAKCQQVLGVTITGAGSGYSASSPPTPVFSAGAGSGATGYVLLNASGGIASVVMTARGTGYSGSFAVTFSSGAATGTAVVNSGWCRPILDGNHLNFGSVSGFNSIIYSRGNYSTFDNFEIINESAIPASISNAMIQLIAGNGPSSSISNTFENFYLHRWDSSVCFGTGNISAGSSTVTNFVPTSGQCTTDILASLSGGSFSVTTPIQVPPQGSYWSVQANGPAITGVSGANPYTITTSSTTVGTTCTACTVQIGGAASMLGFYGNHGGNTGLRILNNVIDGKDTFAAMINPYPDCGTSEGLNTPCISPSLVAGWRAGGEWSGNTIQFIDNGQVGDCGQVHDNLMQYLRTGTNPTGHTNIWESIGPAGDDATTGCLMYNNLWYHTTNPSTLAIPARNTVGLSIDPEPTTGQTAYLFNNVFSDTITNTVIESGGSGGAMIAFNNTLDCGPQWNLSYTCIQLVSGGSTTSKNNLYITTSGSPYSGAVTNANDVLWTPATAATAGLTPSQSPYIYSPTSSNCGGVNPCTVGSGASIAAFCTSLTALFPAAGTACAKDSTYGASYDSTHNTSSAGLRTALARSTTTPDVGAFQVGTPQAAAPTFSPVASPPAYNGTQTVTLSTSSAGCSGSIQWNTTGLGGGTVGTTVTVSVSETVFAQVVGCAGFTDSTVSSAAYTINPVTSVSGTVSGAVTFKGSVIKQ